MKTKRTLALTLLIFLILSPLTSSFAQERVSQASLDAKRDADQDVNKLLWIGAGLVSVAAPVIFGTAGALIGGQIDPPQSTGLFFIEISDGQFYGCCVGTTIGLLLPFGLVRSAGAEPSPERFLGKSAEYVEAYNKAYTQKVKSVRSTYTLVGLGTGCMFGTILISSIADN